MSVGNLKDQGNKGNNFPYQLAVLKLLDAINSSISSLPGVDYESRTTMYQAIAPGPGYSIGDIIIRYDIIDVATSTLTATIWFNQTTQAAIVPPAAANLVPIAAPSAVTVINGVLGAAVNIQDGGNSITVDNAFLDVLLSTRASEATLLTRLSKADFEARINTLGQKTMAASTPITIASDQTTLPVSLATTVRTPSYTVAVAPGVVAAGARSVSVFNSGTTAGVWLGSAIAPGVQLSFSAGGQGDTLSAFAYTASATAILQITTVV